MSKTFQTAGANTITFADNLDMDNVLQFSSQRSITDSSKARRFLRLSAKAMKPVWIGKPGCADGCLDMRSTQALSTGINVPAPTSEAEVLALKLAIKAHFADVLEAVETYNWLNGSLPPSSASFDGTYVSVIG